MTKKAKRKVLELVTFILLCIIYIWLANYAAYLMHNLNPYSYLWATVVFMIYYFLLGMFLNKLNKTMLLKNFRISSLHFITAVSCIVLVALLWIFMRYLPGFLFTRINIVSCLITAFAGANLTSALCEERGNIDSGL